MKCALKAMPSPACKIMLRRVWAALHLVYSPGGAIERLALAVPLYARPAIIFAVAGFYLCVSVVLAEIASRSPGVEALAAMAVSVASLVRGAVLAVAAIRLVG